MHDRTTSYWRNGGLKEKLKVSPFFVATAFYISFFHKFRK
jgi:hypothetical protein